MTGSVGNRVVLVPGVLALLPEHAGLVDPVAELRAACLAAVSWLGADVTVLGDDQGRRVAGHLLDSAGRGGGADTSTATSYLVVGNGSARRSEKAPGHLDPRAHAFDQALAAGLRAGRPVVELGLAGELLASVDGIVELPGLLDGSPAVVDYDDDPFGVQYWVMRWQCES